MGRRYMKLLTEFLAEDRAVDADWRERAHGMEALVAFAAWLDAAQQVAEADRASSDPFQKRPCPLCHAEGWCKHMGPTELWDHP